MNPQQTQQVVARDEKWVPSAEKVKISFTNIRLETTVPQKEETFQQFWYTIKRVQDTDSYEFILANKKCTVNAEVFRTILNICPRVKGEDFTDVLDDEIVLTFLIDLGYKGPQNRHTNMFIDHMHQSENVDYPELIWEDLAYHIDHKKEKRSRREDYQEYGHHIPDVMLTDAIKHSESYQMFIKYLTNQIPPKKSRGKESKPEPEPAKKKTTSRRVVKKKVILSADDNIIFDDPDTALELANSIGQTKAEEAEAARKVHATHARIVTEYVPEFAKKKSGGRTTNIIQALKESKKTSKRLPSTGGSNKETSTTQGVLDESIVVSATSSEGNGAKLGVLDEDKDITEEKVILEWGDEQDSEHSDDDNDDAEKDEKDGDADDEGSDHVSDKQDDDDEDDETESDKDDIYKYKILVRKDEYVEMKDAEVKGSDKGDEEITDAAKEEPEKTLEAKDDTKKSELPSSSSSLSGSSGFGDQFLKLSYDSSLVSIVKDSAAADKIPVSVIPEITNLPPIPEIVTETLVITADPSNQVTLIISIVQQTTTLIPTPTSTTDALTITTIVFESNALTAVELRVAKLEKDMTELKTSDHSYVALVVLQYYVPIVVDSYLDTKVKDVFQKELQKHTADLIHKYSLQHLPELTKNRHQQLNKNLRKVLQRFLRLRWNNLRVKRTHSLPSSLLTMQLLKTLIEDKNIMDKGVADTVKYHKRKHDDDEDDDDEDPPAGPNQGKKTKRRRTKESESSKNPSFAKETLKGKALTKGSKTGKFVSTKEPIEEPIAEVIMDDAGDDLVCDDDQPQATSKPKTSKTLNLEWFKQPPRPPTPDPEWNKRQVVLYQPAQPWFNQMVSASKDPLTFNDLMATPIDFSKYVLNGLKIENLTQDILLGPTFNLLKGMCTSSIELEYNFQECFNLE
ncbi:hypothetical protein Tco_0727492 [Tanacetum coccineum]|uniref:BTB domain-containing protein n=1 Tax=Tanacetum coccineum TaxID=301880 RepID=A0ABQ4YKU5_9ASTR